MEREIERYRLEALRNTNSSCLSIRPKGHDALAFFPALVMGPMAAAAKNQGTHDHEVRLQGALDIPVPSAC